MTSKSINSLIVLICYANSICTKIGHNCTNGSVCVAVMQETQGGNSAAGGLAQFKSVQASFRTSDQSMCELM